MSPLRLSPASLSSLSGEVEKDVQARGVALLRQYGWFVLEMDKAAWGSVRKGAFFVGFPDVLALRRANFLLIEFKSRTGKARADQLAMHDRLANHGINVHVIRAEREVLALLSPRSSS